jgi:hypothetical protein
VPLPFDQVVTDEHVEMGRQLCENLMEPLIQMFGPCSLATGLCFSGPGPHQWLRREGVAVDAAFHDWVNQDLAPIKLVEEIVKSELPFERLITYAGSEFICMAWKKPPRYALYENIRVPGSPKPTFNQMSRHPGEYAKMSRNFPERPDWRRGPNEVIYHSRRSLRAHHVRCSQYFTLLDFCRSEDGIHVGEPWVLPVQAVKQAHYGRMFGEVLDPVVSAFGRVSVTQGVVPPKLASRMGKKAEFYRWLDGPAALQFLLPQSADVSEAVRILKDHASVTDIQTKDHPSEACKVSIKIEPFEPKTIYSGGYPYGYYAGEMPAYIPEEAWNYLK